MKRKLEILAVPSDEDWVIDGDEPIGQHMLEPFMDDNGEIRKELFDEIDGKFYQKKGLVNINGKLELPKKEIV